MSESKEAGMINDEPDMTQQGPPRFQDRLAVITGAGSGIGRAAALRLAGEGADVACLDIDGASASATATEINAGPTAATSHHCDVTDDERVAAVFDDVERTHGRPIHVLVANAGIEGPLGFVTDISVEEWNKTLAVNLTGPFLCSRHAIPSMRRAGGGAIVITGSNSCFIGYPRWAAYTATKGGVLMLMKNLAVDHAPDGIRVNCVCPGPTDTALLRRGFERALGSAAEAEETLDRRGSVGRPEDIASVIAFLASDEARMMTGAAVAADFGNTARGGPTWPSPHYWD
jgi:NAD(P)-dependent dehydrogenase (short-subunit alcohol dehydrogenase family)